MQADLHLCSSDNYGINRFSDDVVQKIATQV